MRPVLMLLATAGLMLVLSCGAADDQADNAESAGSDLPEGAIRTDDDIYMVPLDVVDEDGCRPYRLFSPGRLTVQMLYYRRADGSFTPDKGLADCSAATEPAKDNK